MDQGSLERAPDHAVVDDLFAVMRGAYATAAAGSSMQQRGDRPTDVTFHIFWAVAPDQGNGG